MLICIWIYIYIFPSHRKTICWVHIMLLVCVSSEPSVQYWTTNWCALLWEDYGCLSQFDLIACSSLGEGWWLTGFSPCGQAGLLVSSLFNSYFGRSWCGDFMGVASDVTGTRNLTANSPILWFWTSLSISPSTTFPESLAWRCWSYTQISGLQPHQVNVM